MSGDIAFHRRRVSSRLVSDFLVGVFPCFGAESPITDATSGPIPSMPTNTRTHSARIQGQGVEAGWDQASPKLLSSDQQVKLLLPDCMLVVAWR